MQIILVCQDATGYLISVTNVVIGFLLFPSSELISLTVYMCMEVLTHTH